jgi:hypothetical protein
LKDSYKTMEQTYQTAQHHSTLAGSYKMMEPTYQTVQHHTT